MAKTALDVACPHFKCGAEPGEECAEWGKLIGATHEARKLAAMELDMMDASKTHVASDAMIEDVAKELL